jgi:predicted MFS family arabinose efflux permease
VSGTVVVGQFAASTFVTPFLLRNAHMSSDLATVLLLGYGLAGIAGTLINSPLVARGPARTFMGAAAAFGALLIVLPEVSSAARASR